MRPSDENGTYKAGAGPKTIQHDRFTWLAYGMLGYYSYMQVSLGPSMPFLRSEHKLNYTEGSLHLSAFAVGMIVAGLVADRLERRLGRYLVWWGGALGMGLGTLLLMLAEPTVLTLAATLLMGSAGSLLLVAIQAGLADRHGENRAVALTESNVIASLTAILAPLMVGSLESLGLGWRSAIGLSVVLMLAAFLLFRKIPIPAKPPAEPARLGREDGANPDQRLPLAFWAYWFAIVFGVACEWCMSFWSTDYLITQAGLSQTSAATLLSLFFIAMFFGRIGGSYLVRRFETGRLILIAIAIAGVGFPFFWLVPNPALKIAGLFVVGLGIANFFPLVLSAATGTAPALAGTASSRIALGAGTAILTAPLVLGWTGDQLGLVKAFGVFPVCLALVLAATVVALRANPRLAKAASVAAQEPTPCQ
jgi:MFS family permease